MHAAGSQSRGTILLVVVMMVSLLAVVVGQLSLTSGTAAVTAVVDRRALQHELALQSGLDFVLAQLQADADVFAFKRGRRPSRGVFALQIGPAEVRGVVDDESAKLELVSLCREQRGKEAEALLLRAVNRVRSSGLRMNFAPLAVLADQRRRPPRPTEPRLRPIHRLEQLIVADEPAWPVLYARDDGRPYVGEGLTIFSNGKVNVFAADPQVTEIALGGVPDQVREQVLAALERADDVSLTAILDEANVRGHTRWRLRDLISTQSTCFTVRLTSVIGHDRRDAMAVIESGAADPAVVQWCEFN